VVYKTKSAGRQPGRRVPGNPAPVLDRDLLQKITVDNQNGVAYSIIQQSEVRRLKPPSKAAPLKVRQEIK
jgi:hypothetical protein